MKDLMLGVHPLDRYLLRAYYGYKKEWPIIIGPNTLYPKHFPFLKKERAPVIPYRYAKDLHSSEEEQRFGALRSGTRNVILATDGWKLEPYARAGICFPRSKKLEMLKGIGLHVPKFSDISPANKVHERTQFGHQSNRWFDNDQLYYQSYIDGEEFFVTVTFINGSVRHIVPVQRGSLRNENDFWYYPEMVDMEALNRIASKIVRHHNHGCVWLEIERQDTNFIVHDFKLNYIDGRTTELMSSLTENPHEFPMACLRAMDGLDSYFKPKKSGKLAGFPFLYPRKGEDNTIREILYPTIDDVEIVKIVRAGEKLPEYYRDTNDGFNVGWLKAAHHDFSEVERVMDLAKKTSIVDLAK